MNQVLIFCDGCCEPRNPGGFAGWGWYAVYKNKIIASRRGCEGHGEGMTNNRAEYAAALDALRWLDKQKTNLAKNQVAEIVIQSDSQLIVNQISGAWQCGAENLKPLCAEAQNMAQKLGVAFKWIPREQNAVADELSRQAVAEYRAAQRAL